MVKYSNEQKPAMVKLVSESFIKPKIEVDATKHQPRYHLSPIDLAMLSLDYMQKGLLFSNPSEPKAENHMEKFMEKLKMSLSLALVHFYPFAGRFETEKYEDEHSCLIFVNCNKGPGTRIIHASALDLFVSDILSPTYVPLIVPSFFDLGERGVNHDGHTRSLLSIQVTELLDGIFLGFTANHSVADGSTLWNLITTLSEIFQSLNVNGENEDIIPITHTPKYKPFFPKGYGPNPTLKLPYLDPKEFIVRYEPCELRERIFHFSAASLAKFKAKANEQCGNHDITISSFQALSALVWRAITRARNLSSDEDTSCMLIANARPRLSPPYSQDYFGNFLTRARGVSNVGELLGRDLGWAAMLMNQGVKEQDDKAIHDFLNYYASAPFVCQPRTVSAFYEPNNVLIGGSPRFDMYGSEFGLGKPVAVRNGYNNKDDGKLTANPGSEGGGSIDLEVCLKPDTMAALELDEEFMAFVFTGLE